MLTSQTDRKSACKTYNQLILGKKSEKFVLTTQNCPVCLCQRDDISLATPGTARLVGKAGCLQRLRVLLVSSFPRVTPRSCCPSLMDGGWALTPAGLEIFSSVVMKLFLLHFFSSTCQLTQLPPSAPVCFSANVCARELMPCVFPGKPTRTISEIKFRHTKVKV